MSIRKALGRGGVVLVVAVMVVCGGGSGGDDGGNSKTESSSDKVKGGSGKVASVKIGKQTWTKENLNVETSNSWCYKNDPSNCAEYGRLYTWEAAKKACASMGGKWRLPTKQDWNNLVGYAGGEGVAGKKLKSNSGWNNNGNGTDDYGFSALPGGGRTSAGGFVYVGRTGDWWSATEESGGYGYTAYRRLMSSDHGRVGEISDNKEYGFAVRCVQ